MKVNWRNIILGNKARPRMLFVAWMVCLGRLPTKDRLSRHGVITDGRCVLCGDKESIDHLCFKCHDAEDVWNSFLDWMPIQMKHTNGKWNLDWFVQRTKGKSIASKRIKVTFAEALYSIWTVRNCMIFQGKTKDSLNMGDIKEKIRLGLDKYRMIFTS